MATAGKTKVAGETLAPETAAAVEQVSAPADTLATIQALYAATVSLESSREDVLAALERMVTFYRWAKLNGQKAFDEATKDFLAAYEKACEPFDHLRKAHDKVSGYHKGLVMFARTSLDGCDDIENVDFRTEGAATKAKDDKSTAEAGK